MKKIILCLTIILFLTACSKPIPEKNVENFTFSLEFGSGPIPLNCIDTYEGTFTKDLINFSNEHEYRTQTIEFNIPDEKMQEIYDLFLEKEIYDLPDDVSGESFIRPSSHIIFKYTWGDETRTIICNNAYLTFTDRRVSETHSRLVHFAFFITEYIYSTEEYQNMKPTIDGYL